MSPTIVALVPMRHESERVPGKNYRPLGGRPLFHHIVSALEHCARITKTVIDTDSKLIREDATNSFPRVEVIDRPAHLRDGATPMNSILLHDVQEVEADLYLQTHSTNPLLRSDSIERAIEAFIAASGTYDSLFSVTRLQTRLWSGDGTPINHERHVLARTQDLPPVFEENSCVYLFSRASLELRGNRIGERPLMFELPKDEAWDIDDEMDFVMAEALYMKRQSA